MRDLAFLVGWGSVAVGTGAWVMDGGRIWVATAIWGLAVGVLAMIGDGE